MKNKIIPELLDNLNLIHFKLSEHSDEHKLGVSSYLKDCEDGLSILQIHVTQTWLKTNAVEETCAKFISEWKQLLPHHHYRNGFKIYVFCNLSYEWQSEINSEADEYIAGEVQRLLCDAKEYIIYEHTETI